jgi:hypothetical protein
MSKTTYRLLVLVVLILPVWLIGCWLGLVPSVPRSWFGNLAVGTAVVVVPVLAAGVLTIAALRSVQRDGRISDTEKRKWRSVIFFTGPIGAILHFEDRLRDGHTD